MTLVTRCFEQACSRAKNSFQSNDSKVALTFDLSVGCKNFMTSGVDESDKHDAMKTHSLIGTFFRTKLPKVTPTYIINSMIKVGPCTAIRHTLRILSGENSNPAKNKMKNTPNSPIVST